MKRSLYAALIITIGLGCQFFIFDPSLFSQMEVILTSTLDDKGQPNENVTRFNSTVKRIYCVIRLDSETGGVPVRSSMIIKWYYGSKEITSHSVTADTLNPVTVWLEPVEGEAFEAGDYSVKIFIQDQLIRTIDFQIE